MNILDRLAINSLIKTILNFILGLLKIFAPKSIEDLDIPKPDKPVWKPKRRKKDE